MYLGNAPKPFAYYFPRWLVKFTPILFKLGEMSEDGLQWYILLHYNGMKSNNEAFDAGDGVSSSSPMSEVHYPLLYVQDNVNLCSSVSNLFASQDVVLFSSGSVIFLLLFGNTR
jgi:hypothetical protein